ncbi:Pyridoxine-5'-phosphate oxidase [Lamellibrachia satsuma]|nr:Pyridoxine-5'-phosphate oxidase [Lamellibrachia satsuma]
MTPTHYTLTIPNLPSKDPLTLFQKWFEEAQYNDSIRLATSMILATSSKDGRPSIRIVGVKGFDKTGFQILTNQNSKKAKDLKENPYASIMFYWEPMDRMVRVEVRGSRLPDEEAERMWRGFPLAAQLVHSSSHQDEVIASREVVLKQKEEVSGKYQDDDGIPMNPDWCAFTLVPYRYEFYQVATDMPDRIIFRRPEAGDTPDGTILHRGDDGWLIEVLSP